MLTKTGANPFQSFGTVTGLQVRQSSYRCFAVSFSVI
jgi:hypothetical protein